MKVLVINSGSSSIKYRLFDMVDKSVLATGRLEQIGETESCLTHRSRSVRRPPLRRPSWRGAVDLALTGPFLAGANS